MRDLRYLPVPYITLILVCYLKWTFSSFETRRSSYRYASQEEILIRFLPTSTFRYDLNLRLNSAGRCLKRTIQTNLLHLPRPVRIHVRIADGSGLGPGACRLRVLSNLLARISARMCVGYGHQIYLTY